MPEDADLTEFLDRGDAAADEETSADGSTDSGGADDAAAPADGEDGAPGARDAGSAATGEDLPEPGEVALATPTGAWTAGGAACEACGETARRRWRDDGRLVCADCKAW